MEGRPFRAKGGCWNEVVAESVYRPVSVVSCASYTHVAGLWTYCVQLESLAAIGRLRFDGKRHGKNDIHIFSASLFPSDLTADSLVFAIVSVGVRLLRIGPVRDFDVLGVSHWHTIHSSPFVRAPMREPVVYICATTSKVSNRTEKKTRLGIKPEREGSPVLFDADKYLFQCQDGLSPCRVRR